MMDFQLFTETPACGWSFEFPKVVAAVVPPLLDFRALNLLQCTRKCRRQKSVGRGHDDDSSKQMDIQC